MPLAVSSRLFLSTAMRLLSHTVVAHSFKITVIVNEVIIYKDLLTERSIRGSQLMILAKKMRRGIYIPAMKNYKAETV